MDGFVFPSGDSHALAEKMNRIVSLPASEREEMGRAGRRKIESRYNTEQHYESLMELYQSILHSSTHGKPSTENAYC